MAFFNSFKVNKHAYQINSKSNLEVVISEFKNSLFIRIIRILRLSNFISLLKEIESHFFLNTKNSKKENHKQDIDKQKMIYIL
jgi:hypothetical protein